MSDVIIVCVKVHMDGLNYAFLAVKYAPFNINKRKILTVKNTFAATGYKRRTRNLINAVINNYKKLIRLLLTFLSIKSIKISVLVNVL